jgi:hypothetical protein
LVKVDEVDVADKLDAVVIVVNDIVVVLDEDEDEDEDEDGDVVDKLDVDIVVVLNVVMLVTLQGQAFLCLLLPSTGNVSN